MIEYINTLFSEKSKVEASRMIGKEYPLTKLRECATYLNEKFPNDFNFKVDGNDYELYKSILEFEKKYRP
ncbi:MAG: hypothetical protein ACLTON_01225 [Christensenellales bacterium]|jgi:hypothetical protein